MKNDIRSLRSTLECLDAAGELIATDVEVDPHLEVAAIQKHFDGGAALLFNKVKGYPNARRNLSLVKRRFLIGLDREGVGMATPWWRNCHRTFLTSCGLMRSRRATSSGQSP